MTKIYYFSGTGNSLWTAKKIAEHIAKVHHSDKCELINIGAESQKENVVIDAEVVILVFPSYGYGLPRIVRRFVKNAFFQTSYIASLVTFGSSPRGTLGSLRRILKRKGTDKLFFVRIPSIENYLALFGPPKEELIESRRILQEEATKKAATDIIERQVNSVSGFYPFSAFISFLFFLGTKIFYKRYRIGENCNGCAVCQRVCPAAAITMKDGKPEFSSKCEHCQGCINICPLRAIKFGRVKFGTPGYRHPEIEIAELGQHG